MRETIYLFLNGCLNLWVASFVQSEAWEQVIDEGHKQRFILIHLLQKKHCMHHVLSEGQL